MTTLVNYSGSSSEDEADNSDLAVKRKHRSTSSDDASEEAVPSSKCLKTNRSVPPSKPKSGLPLPGAIQSLFSEADGQWKDDPELHGGRARTVPHVEGNWASYVYVPISPDARLKAFMDQLSVCLRPLNFEHMDDLHLSLSRTVYIRHHWIQPLTETLKEQMRQLDSCFCDITSVKLYTNDEKTRTFLSLEVSLDGTNLTDYVAVVDSCFKEFNLPGFYKDPSFHVSLMWCVGDVIPKISEKTINKIQMLTREFLSTHIDLSVISIDQVYFKTGNKTFSFHLQNADQ